MDRFLPMQFVISSTEAILVSLLGMAILNFKPSRKQIILIGLIEGLFGTLVTYLDIPFGLHTIIQFFSFSAIIYLVMFITYKASFLITLLGFCISMCLQVILFPVFLSITGISYLTVANNLELKLLFSTVFVLCSFIVLYLIKRLDLNLARYFRFANDLGADQGETGKAYYLISLFLAQNFFIALFYGVNYASSNDSQITNILIVYPPVPLTIITLLTIAAIYTIKKIITQLEKEIETKKELDSLRHVEELLNTIRAQRHDFTHHLQTVYGLLEVEAFPEAKEYIQNHVLEVAATSELIKTDNLAITSLLFTKTGIAEAKGISFHVSVQTSLGKLPVETAEVNTILGNLIDNAFEAVDGMTGENRKVEVTIDQDADGFYFKVRNYGPPILPHLKEEIFRAGFSTKRNGRGMGLYSVQNIVNKYGGHIDVVSNEKNTVFCVFIPHKR